MLPIALFASCNLDSLLLLMILFCSKQFRVSTIVIAQFLSQGILVLSSMAIAALTFQVASHYVGLLGLLPLASGIAKLVERYCGRRSEIDAGCRGSTTAPESVWATTLLMLSAGGDNLSAYVPVFTVSHLATVIYYCGVFSLMTAAWCVLSYSLARHSLYGAVVRSYSERLLPWNMIGLGIYVLSGSARYFLRW